MRQGELITPDQPVIRKFLDQLWDVWSDVCGVSYSFGLDITDVDDTAVVFILLHWGGYPVSADVFNFYEKENYIAAYTNETDPCIAANIRTLAALKCTPDHPLYESRRQKIINFLLENDANGSFWSDKYQASPYYVSSFALNVLGDVDLELAQTRLRWILNTQNDDGGWGLWDKSTPEETAYCLLALLQWNRDVMPISWGILEQAAEYLSSSITQKTFPAMWIAKSLYSPGNIPKSAILAAMNLYERY